MPRLLSRLLALLLAGSIGGSGRGVASEPAKAVAEWPCWRGPTFNGASPNNLKLLDSWPNEGPKLVWRTTDKIPGNISSPVVADGKVFVWVSWNHPLKENSCHKQRRRH